jgi:hypothetical protein
MKSLKENSGQETGRLSELTEQQKVGPHEQMFLDFCEKEMKIISAVYFGGAWEGNACRKFLGMAAGRKTDPHKWVTFQDAIDETCLAHCKLRGECNVENPNDSELYNFLEKMEELTKLLSTAMTYITSTDGATFDTAEKIEAGNSACRAYVQKYREHFVAQDSWVLNNQNVTVKMHILETHVPEFILNWQCAAVHGEDVIESLHKDVNELKRRFASIQNMVTYMQACEDEQSLKYEQKSHEAGAEKGEHSKKRK